MVVPGLYGYVSATKWITDLAVTTFGAEKSYWLPRGGGAQGPIKTGARTDPPPGIAWSQPTGIGKVEVRMDGGAWREAELATKVSGDTWRMWRADFDLGPGS